MLEFRGDAATGSGSTAQPHVRPGGFAAGRFRAEQHAPGSRPLRRPIANGGKFGRRAGPARPAPRPRPASAMPGRWPSGCRPRCRHGSPGVAPARFPTARRPEGKTRGDGRRRPAFRRRYKRAWPPTGPAYTPRRPRPRATRPACRGKSPSREAGHPAPRSRWRPARRRGVSPPLSSRAICRRSFSRLIVRSRCSCHVSHTSVDTVQMYRSFVNKRYRRKRGRKTAKKPTQPPRQGGTPRETAAVSPSDTSTTSRPI